MEKAERRTYASQHGGWEPWEEGFLPTVPDEAQLAGMMKLGNLTREQAISTFADLQSDKVMLNNFYQVNIRRVPLTEGWPEMIHLSIKRRDKKPLGTEHFRHLQRIKNELIGPECEAVELYPAESRLIDTANQYHLWVLIEPGMRFPFGWTDRLVTGESHGDAVQQPFE